MKRNRDVMLRLGYSTLLVFALFISACATKLIDIEKSVPGLNLSKEQMEVVEPKMIAIRDMVEMYNEDKEQLEEELSSMMGSGMGGGKGGGMGRDRGEGRSEGGSGFREKFAALRKKREAYLSAINIHVADIEAVLNEEQLVAFEKMKMPELEMPETPGGGRRGGTGGRRGGGMGGGGRGGGRGGGMF